MAGTRLTIDQAELERLSDFMAEQAARDTSGLMPRLSATVGRQEFPGLQFHYNG